MRIPEEAIIPAGKIVDYLLAPRPTNDKSKYLARAGFARRSVSALEAEIRRLSSECDAVIDRVNIHGTYYNVTGSLIGPNGLTLSVRLVWLHRVDDVFTFVTLVPMRP